jgi:type IX secretion system PorP/SprF family membrane protein
MYSYPVEISGSLSANFGLQAGIVQKNMNAGKLILGDQNPFEPTSGEIIPDESKFFPDFSAGASILIKEQYQVNFSVHHLSQPNESPGEAAAFTSPFRFSFQAFTQFPAKKKGVERPHKSLIWRPGIMAQVQGQSNLISWGTNVLFSNFTAGIWFRNNTGLSLNTVNFLGGYTWSGLSVYYSYEAWIPGNYQQLKNYGAHEVTFIYLFQYNDPRKKMKPIKCPKF